MLDLHGNVSDDQVVDGHLVMEGSVRAAEVNRWVQSESASFGTGDMFLSENGIYQGDAKELLKCIRPDSVALSFWSPPYFVGKSYERDWLFEDWTNLLSSVIRLHYPITKPGGFLAINIADILALPDPSMPRIQADNITNKKSRITREAVLEAKEHNPGLNKYELAALLGCSEQTIDRRLKHNNVRGGKYAIQRKVKLVGGMIEDWASEAGFFLYDRRAWVKDPCWENSRWHSLSYRAVDEFEYIYVFWKPGITTVDRSRLTAKEWSEWGSRGVWNIPSVRVNEIHEAQFPMELARRVIRIFSGSGDLVLDCFVGSGTTAVVAAEQNRRFLGIDLVEKYAKLARERYALAQAKLPLELA